MGKTDINWKKVMTRALYSISFIIISELYPLINRYTGRERSLVTFIDNMIPFNKYFIYPYVVWYVYIAFFLVYFCIFDEKKYYKILTGVNAGMLISYAIYLIYPTVVTRPVFSMDGGMTSWLFKWLYSRDNPYNCFPSIHVINTLIIAIYAQKDNLYLNKYVKAFSHIVAALIIYSTLAIKQHVLPDAVSAAVIAYALYGIMDYKEIFGKFKKDQTAELQRINQKNGVV